MKVLKSGESEFLAYLASEAPKLIEQSPGLKPAVLGAGIGTPTTVIGTDWISIIGLVLTFLSVLIAGGSLWLGYLNFKERQKENQLKEMLAKEKNDRGKSSGRNDHDIRS